MTTSNRVRWGGAPSSRGLLLGCSICISLLFPLWAQELPAGTTLEARLSTPTGSRISRVGDPVEATIIAPISSHGQILIPQRSTLFGSVETVQPFGFGLREITATIHFRFHTLRFPAGDTIPIEAEVLEVETAKERVDVEGTVRGIHPAASVSSSLALFTVPLLFVVPAIGGPVWGLKSMVSPAADPEIYFPAGTELILRLTAPINVPSNGGTHAGMTTLSPDDQSEVRRLLKGWAQRTKMGNHPSDLVNLLFFGSREEIDRAFHAAGWFQAQRKSPLSLYRMYHALTERSGYRSAPMNALTLNGRPSDFDYQKSLDTVQKRHHVRIWKDPQSPDVWRGAAAEDIAFRFELAHWTHSTAPDIDIERAKIVNDLAFTGCLDSAALMKRNSPDLLLDPKAKRPIVTDTNIAVMRLDSCYSPETMPGVDIESSVPARGHISRIWASLRNDLRLNLFFTTYNTVKFVAEQRVLKPLRNTPGLDSNSPGLGWLSSLVTQAEFRPERGAPALVSSGCCPQRGSSRSSFRRTSLPRRCAGRPLTSYVAMSF